MRSKPIINRRYNHHKPKYHDRPVHIRGSRHRVGGEETHDEAQPQETERDDVDDGAVFAEGPAAGEEGLFADAFEEDEGDGGYVRDQQGGVAQ